MKATLDTIRDGGYALADVDRGDLALGFICYYTHQIYHRLLWPLRAPCEWLEVFGFMWEDRDKKVGISK